MSRLKLPTLFEAAAITVCLFYTVGQQAETGTLMSQTTIKTFQGTLNSGLMQTAGQTTDSLKKTL